jgi:ATP-dependent helicase/nuclease subunit A
MVPGYAVESVTSLAKKDMEVPEWRRGSYGMAWGRAVHKMLETLARGDGYGDSSGDTGTDRYNRKISLLAKNVLVTEEISMEKKGELVSLVESIMKSEFWERVKKAEKKLFEVPFSIMTDKEVLPTIMTETKEGLPTILTGVIDLAFLESGGWIIADFKTDDVRDSKTDDVKNSKTDDIKDNKTGAVRDYKTDDVRDNLESFVNYYAPQVKIYSRFWAEITKQPIKETGLYFTSINKWIEVK